MENPIAINIVEEVNTLDHIIQSQSRDIKEMKSEVSGLTLKCKALVDENMNLKAEFGGSVNQKVEAENLSLKEEVSCLNKKVINLENESSSLKEKVINLENENLSLKEEVSCLNEKVKTLEDNYQRIMDSLALLTRKYIELKNRTSPLPDECESSAGDKADELPLTVSDNGENLPSTASNDPENLPSTASNDPENLPGATSTESEELQSLTDKFACLSTDLLAAEMWNTTMQELGTMNGQELVDFVKKNSKKFGQYTTTVSAKNNFFDAMKNTCEQKKLSKGVLKKLKTFF